MVTNEAFLARVADANSSAPAWALLAGLRTLSSDLPRGINMINDKTMRNVTASGGIAIPDGASFVVWRQAMKAIFGRFGLGGPYAFAGRPNRLFCWLAGTQNIPAKFSVQDCCHASELVKQAALHFRTR